MPSPTNFDLLKESAVLNHLPRDGWLYDYVRYAMARCDGHAIYHVGAGLAVLGQTMHPDLCFISGGKTYPTLYTILIGPSTNSRKTVSLSIGMRLLQDYTPESIGGQPDSRQGLLKSLAHNPQQLICYPEFGEALLSFQQQYLGPLKMGYCAAYDNLPLSQMLSKERTKVANPRLSLLCACAPDFLENYTTAVDWTGGFFARFMLLYGERERLIPEDERNEDVATRNRLGEAVRKMRKEGEGTLGYLCTGFDKDPRIKEALKEWSAWTAALRIPPIAAPSIARTQDFLIKLALLFAWDSGRARRGIDFKLTLDEIVPAIYLCKYHTISALRIVSDVAASPAMRDRKVVLNAIPWRGSTPVGLDHVIRESRLLKRRALEIIDSLLEERAIIQNKSHDDFTNEEKIVYNRIDWRKSRSVEDSQQDAKVIRLDFGKGSVKAADVLAALEEAPQSPARIDSTSNDSDTLASARASDSATRSSVDELLDSTEGPADAGLSEVLAVVDSSDLLG